MKRTIGIVGTVIGLGIVLVLTLMSLNDRTDSGPSRPIAERGLDREILAALERIEEALGRLEARGTVRAAASRPIDVPGTPDSAPRTLLGPAADPEDLARLHAALAEVRGMLADHVDAERLWREKSLSLGELKSANRDADWVALDDLMRRWHVDPDVAAQEEKLSTFHDVVKRYGSPTEVWTNDGGAHWVYQRGYDANGQAIDEVYFRFNDGYVTVVGVK